MIKFIKTIIIVFLLCMIATSLSYGLTDNTLILLAIFLYFIKSLYKDLTTNVIYSQSSFNPMCNTFNFEESNSYQRYYPQYNQQFNGYQPYSTKADNEIKLQIVKQLLPSLSIDLGTEEETHQLNEKKKAYIEKITSGDSKTIDVSVCPVVTASVSKPIALLPPSPQTLPSTETKSKEMSSFFVVNAQSLPQIKENVYQAIISSLKDFHLSLFVMREALANIKYIEIVAIRDNEINIYVKSIPYFKKYGINLDKVIENVKKINGVNGSINIIQYNVCDISDYFDKNYS